MMEGKYIISVIDNETVNLCYENRLIGAMELEEVPKIIKKFNECLNIGFNTDEVIKLFKRKYNF